MATTTDYLGLKKPAQEDYYNVDDWNDNSDTLDQYAAGLSGEGGVIPALQAAVAAAAKGLKLKGAVNYYADLPATGVQEGDAWTVLYSGSSGTEALGLEYAWAKYNDVLQWVPIGVDPSAFAKQTDMAQAQSDISALQTAKASVSQAFGRGTYIPTNGSMDDLSGYGRFYSDNASHSATITNAPFTVAGFICEQTDFYQSASGVTGKMQIAYTITSGAYTERRRFYTFTGGGVGWRWTNWVTTVSIAVSYPEQSNSL